MLVNLRHLLGNRYLRVRTVGLNVRPERNVSRAEASIKAVIKRQINLLIQLIGPCMDLVIIK